MTDRTILMKWLFAICIVLASCSGDGGQEGLSTLDIIKKDCGLLEEKCGKVSEHFIDLQKCVEVKTDASCYNKRGLVKCNYRCTKEMRCDESEGCYYDCVIKHCTPPN